LDSKRFGPRKEGEDAGVLFFEVQQGEDPGFESPTFCEGDGHVEVPSSRMAEIV
jgi:hypothetical protein